ncbi:hypothetical protein AB1Y20_016653 [Prymnesium parvum]|uniref:Right handed beta helix domain-containing protein n=1 Tax=Prymnesium parvum TaxID=97485 RepID=A0AB34IDF7_PRYPA
MAEKDYVARLVAHLRGKPHVLLSQLGSNVVPKPGGVASVGKVLRRHPAIFRLHRVGALDAASLVSGAAEPSPEPVPVQQPAQQKAPPSPSVRLATYVRLREAHAFTRVVESEGMSNPILSLVLDDVVSTVRDAAASVFGPDVRVAPAGSVKKQTQVKSSDLDLLVHSAAPATLEQVQALEALLRAHPAANPAHVNHKKLAIHAHLFGVDCDVVCAHTVEHGARPPVDERVAQDPAIAGAARALKMWAERAAKGSRKIPGHALESLALHCHGSEPSSAKVGDGAMQLCVAVLQGVADGGGDAGVLREATRLDKPARSSLATLAQATLHVFAVSRALLPGGCFRTAAEVRVWLIGSGHLWPMQQTLAGLVPGWLLCTPAQQRAADPTFSILTDGEGTVDGDTEEGSSQLDGMRNQWLKLMVTTTPLGAYVQAGSRAESVSDPAMSEQRASAQSVKISIQLAQLQDLHEKGSSVAARMLQSRMLWLMGEAALEGEATSTHDCERAAGYFASSMRSAVADGDPFSGTQYASSDASDERYTLCAASVLSRDACHVDAMLLFAWALRRLGRLPDAEEVLNELIAHHAPSDARGALAMRANLRGNQGRWREFLEDSEHCVRLCPEEPMFHYWAATSRKNLLCETNTAADAALAISSYRRFLAGAAPEGRKVCQALYEVACLQMMIAHKETRPPAGEFEAWVPTVRAAQAAEANRLPIFAGDTCDARSMMLRILKMYESRGADGFVPKERFEEVVCGLPADEAERAEALRERGNKAFAMCDFFEADESYTKALQLAPGHAELLANRAAARIKLRWFTAAATDAMAALDARPRWAKAHYRVAQAHMGRRDGASAAAAASKASELLPGDAAIRQMLEEAQALEAAQSGAQSPPDPRSDPQLWERVAYKDNTYIVCVRGGAAFACVADALQQLTTLPGSPGVTLILLPGVYTEQLHFGNVQVQLLGWTSVATVEQRVEIRSASPSTDVTSGRCSDEYFILITVTGTGASVHLEGLTLMQLAGEPHTTTGNCVWCRQGAAVRVVNCEANTPDSPVFVVSDAGSRLSLTRVEVRRRSSAAVLAYEDSSVECDECTFSQLRKAAVEVRERACAVLRGCHLLKGASQAAVIYDGGARLELYDCLLRHCGQAPSKSAVLAECGMLVMRRCTLEEHPAEAVVLQASEKRGELKTAPVVLLDSCKFNRNHTAVAVYFGSGLLLDCTAHDNAVQGIFIRGVPLRKLLTMRGCTLARNGSTAHPMDVNVFSRTLFEHSVRLDASNAISAAPNVCSDSVSNFVVQLTNAQLKRIACQLL